MKLLFVAASCVSFHARTLETHPLGGTETAIIRLSAALRARGHEVIVAVNHPQPPLSDPLYIPISALGDVGEVDVAIFVRDWRAILSGVSAPVRLLWTPDTIDQPVTLGYADPRVLRELHGIVAVSEWHRHHIHEGTGIPLDKIMTLKNGIDLTLFSKEEIERNPRRLIYSSTPFRGLRFLLPVMKLLRERGIDAELHVFSGYDVYGGAQQRPPREVAAWSALEEQLRKTPGVVLHGNVPQQRLAEEFQRSAVLAYPNLFLETSCITVMESQAAGCVPVTSHFGALPETVGAGGVTIPGTPERPGYIEEFTTVIEELLSDGDRWRALSDMARAQAEWCSWHHRAAEFEAMLTG